jgi:hypothetical protein
MGSIDERRSVEERHTANGAEQIYGFVVGVAALFTVISLVVALLTVPPSDTPLLWARSLARDPAQAWLSVTAFAVAEVASALVLVGLARQLRGTPDRRSALIAAGVGAAGFVANAALTIAAYASAIPRASAAIGQDADALGTVDAARAMVDGIDGVNVVLLGVALLVLVPALSRAAKSPRWLTFVGLAAGITALVGGLHPLVSPLAPVRVLSGVLYLVWLVGLGLRQLQGGRARQL